MSPASPGSRQRLAFPIFGAGPLDFAVAQHDQLAAPSLFGAVDALARGHDGVFALAGFFDGPDLAAALAARAPAPPILVDDDVTAFGLRLIVVAAFGLDVAPRTGDGKRLGAKSRRARQADNKQSGEDHAKGLAQHKTCLAGGPVIVHSRVQPRRKAAVDRAAGLSHVPAEAPVAEW